MLRATAMLRSWGDSDMAVTADASRGPYKSTRGHTKHMYCKEYNTPQETGREVGTTYPATGHGVHRKARSFQLHESQNVSQRSWTKYARVHQGPYQCERIKDADICGITAHKDVLPILAPTEHWATEEEALGRRQRGTIAAAGHRQGEHTRTDIKGQCNQPARTHCYATLIHMRPQAQSIRQGTCPGGARTLLPFLSLLFRRYSSRGAVDTLLDWSTANGATKTDCTMHTIPECSESAIVCGKHCQHPSVAEPHPSHSGQRGFAIARLRWWCAPSTCTITRRSTC
jgi:hypothetical protein